MNLKEIDFKVFVCCYTYNQSRYIVQALDGFCIQKTNFPFVCAIVDDASTDGEQDVISKYIDCNFDKATIIRYETDYAVIIQARHTHNCNCFFVALFLKKNHFRDLKLRNQKKSYLAEWRLKCKFESICEGDDYWIDKRKLQMQYDFLDTHPDYTMVFNAINCLYPDGTIKEEHRYSNDNLECDIRDCIKAGGGYAKVAAMMYVRGMEDYSEWASKSTVGDLPSQLTLFTKGKVMYIDKIVSCYRINSIGSWSLSNTITFKARYAHNKKITKVWRAFDQYTDYKYHNEIKRKLTKNIVNLLPAPLKAIANKIFKFYFLER